MLVLKDIKNEQYFGGVLSIAKNLSQFSKKFLLFLCLVKKKEFSNEIKKIFQKI